MLIETVVINASPLITLFRSNQADLLPRLFGRIIVPDAVWHEVVNERHDAVARELPNQSWPIRESVTLSPRIQIWNLGKGETAVLSYALTNPPVRAVIDDKDARRTAQALGIPIFGTGAILLLAKRRGLLKSVTSGLTKLRDAGLWLSDDIVKLIKTQAGE
jgi:predicted nucleic acid-binding protein